jgi:hypothetical protein
VVWADNRTNDRFDIRYTNSTDVGGTWSSDNFVNDEFYGNSTFPDLVIGTDDVLQITWQGWALSGDYNIQYTVSDDSGSTFDPSMRVDKSDVNDQTLPSISLTPDDLPHFAFKDMRLLNAQVFHTHLHYPRYSNGRIKATADLGSKPKYFSVSTNADMHEKTPIIVRIRTSMDEVDWTIWEEVELEDNDFIIGPGRYIEFEITLTTQRTDLTPYVHNITFDFYHYQIEGSLISEPMESGSNILTAKVYWNGTTNGGNISIALSNDDGGNWTPVHAKGANVTFTTDGNLLRYRITMTHPGSDTPILNDISVHYGIISSPSDVVVDVGHLGEEHYRYNGFLTSSQTVYFTEALADYIAIYGKTGENLTVPISISSASQGGIKVDMIKIVLDLPVVLLSSTPTTDENSVNETERFDFGVKAHDPDGKLVTYKWYFNGTPIPGASSSSWTFSPMSKPPGTYPVKVEVFDGRFTVNRTWQLEVIHINKPPEITRKNPFDSDMGNIEGPFNNMTFSVTASDPDGDPLTYTWKIDGEVVAGAEERIWTWVDPDPAAGDHNITVVVSDQEFDVEQTWTFHAVPVINNPPIIDSVEPKGNVDLLTGSKQTFSVSASDPDGNPLTYRWYLNGNDTGVNGTEYTFKPNKEGRYRIKVEVSDGELMDQYQWPVDVAKKPGGDVLMDLSSMLPWLILIVVLIVVIVAVVVARSRRKPKEAKPEEGPVEVEGEPEKMKPEVIPCTGCGVLTTHPSGLCRNCFYGVKKEKAEQNWECPNCNNQVSPDMYNCPYCDMRFERPEEEGVATGKATAVDEGPKPVLQVVEEYCSSCGELLVEGKKIKHCQYCGMKYHRRCALKQPVCASCQGDLKASKSLVYEAPREWVTPTPKEPPSAPGGPTCPTCGEGVDGNWKICPACNTKLQE